MATYSKPQLERLWIQAGGDPRRAGLMAAIALAESAGRSGVVNSIGATGLWQIHPGGSQYKDPLTNARTAVQKLRTQGLGAWEAYTNGSYRRYLGGGSAGVGSMGAAGPPAAGISSAPASFSSGDARKNLLASLITASQQSGHGRTPDYSPVFAALSQIRQGSAVDSSSTPTGALASGGPSTGGSSLSFLEPFAHKFNLQITSTTEGNHVPGSYHYQGRAVDYGGDPMRMAALQRYALAHPQEFVEVFYTGPGAAPYYVKNGKVYPIASLDRSVRDHHHNHVHLAR